MRRFIPRRRWTIGVAIIACLAAMGLFISAAFGILAGSPSSFESADGDMVVTTGGDHDWANVPFAHVVDLASSQSDDSFVSGQKQDTTCPATYQHGNPPKDDFTDVASYSETKTTSGSNYLHTYLYGATIRFAANGNASENVELKQGKNGSCGNGLLARTQGDKLIAIDYLGGGTNVQFHVLTWVTSSSGFTDSGSNTFSGNCFVGSDTAPCWSSTVSQLSGSNAEGLASQQLIQSSADPIGNDIPSGSNASVENGKNLAAGQFAEFGVDLTAAGIIPANTCTAFPQTVWESRSSGSSFVSTTKDISIENHNISNCGEIKIIKQTIPRGVDQTFSFSSGTGSNLMLPANPLAGGVPCTNGGAAGVDSGGNFCLNDNGNSGSNTSGSNIDTSSGSNSAGNTVDETNVPPGTYSVSEGPDVTGFAFDSLVCQGGTTNVSGRTVTITLAPNDVVACVYTNRQQFGFLKLLKTSSKRAATPLSGANFTITGPNSTALAGSPYTTNADGTICVDHLGLGSYSVQETKAPTGYAIDDTGSNTVNVTASNLGCSDDPSPSMTFTDTPLTNLTFHVESQVSGGTQSQLVCTVSGSNTDIGNSPQPSGSNVGDPETITANGLKPGDYNCTAHIDP